MRLIDALLMLMIKRPRVMRDISMLNARCVAHMAIAVVLTVCAVGRV